MPPRVTSQHIGHRNVTNRRAVSADHRLDGKFCRGVELTIDSTKIGSPAAGPYLFACVLERFLAMYASLNSATRLVARSKQRRIWAMAVPVRGQDLL
jgi:type VI secretion system protein ImpG